MKSTTVVSYSSHISSPVLVSHSPKSHIIYLMHDLIPTTLHELEIIMLWVCVNRSGCQNIEGISKAVGLTIKIINLARILHSLIDMKIPDQDVPSSKRHTVSYLSPVKLCAHPVVIGYFEYIDITLTIALTCVQRLKLTSFMNLVTLAVRLGDFFDLVDNFQCIGHLTTPPFGF